MKLDDTHRIPLFFYLLSKESNAVLQKSDPQVSVAALCYEWANPEFRNWTINNLAELELAWWCSGAVVLWCSGADPAMVTPDLILIFSHC